MKKKQLFAVLLAGSMTVGMAPAAAFAAEETTQTEAQVTDENTENTDTAEADAAAAAEAQKQTEEQAAADAAAKAQEEAAAQAQADAEAQAAAAQADAEAQAVAEAEAKAQEQADEEAEAKAAEVKANGTVVTDEKGLNAAIEAAETVDTTNTAITEVDPTKIVIKGTIELTGSVTIPANKSIVILGADDQAAIHRADGFKGTLFEVSAGSAFYMAKKDATDSEPVGTLEVNGSVTDGTAVEGSLVHVAAGANFSMTTGITLCNNNTTAKGAAIFNEGGNVLITGGTITGNKSDNGAVYSTGTISVKKGEGATDVEPSITDNFKTDGKQANVILSGEGKIEIKGALTDAKIGFSVEDPQADREVIKKADDFTGDIPYAEILKLLAKQYEGDTTKFKVDETTGKLVSVETPVEKPVVTIKSTKWESGTKGTAVITSDKAGQLYYKCVAKGAAAPKIDTTGTGTAVKAGDNTINLTNLSGKEMVLYVCVKGADGSVSDPVNATITLTETPVEPVKKPVVTIKSTKWESGTKGTAVITSDKAGQLYYKCVAKGAAAPKKDTSGIGKAIKAGEATTINLTNLSGKEMDLYVWVKGNDGSVSDQVQGKITLTETPAKPVEKPVVTIKSTKWTSGTKGTAVITSSKAGQLYYKCVAKGAAAPKIDTTGTGTAVKAGDNTINVTNLSGKAMDLYVCVKGSDGSVSDPAKKTITLKQSNTTEIDVHWKGLEWSGNNATVTLSVNVNGTCYYKVVECNEDETSKTPAKSTLKETKSVSANKVTSLQLKNLSTSKGYDLYFYIKAKDGTTTNIKRIELRYGHTPVVPKVTDSKLKGLDNGMEFPVGIFYEFQVIGAGTTNKNPGEGDVKWEPLYWSTVANPKQEKQRMKTWKIGAQKKSSQDTFNLNLYVFFRKWVYTNGQWVKTDTVESALYQIKSAKIVDAAGSGTPDPNNSDGLSGTDPNATVTGEASATSANGDGTTSRSAVSTADNSPIGTMSALAVASLIAGGYVIVRRRKKDI